ncbi:outer membrane protein [Pararhizobium haloflavum]|uniref:outer membrane protein n=1 Tax=Pararhizobium haloflavum TaxID=2037914 RepID=UPI000C17FDE4|nr:outer membrane beta-barrel protein [Pararhizobium haloflavum]
MKRLVLSLAAVAFAAPAVAADAVVYNEPAPPAAPMEMARDWSGFFVGVHAGGAFNPDTGVLTFDRDGDGIFGDTIPTATGSSAFGNNFDGAFDSGFVGGAHVGYDQQFGSIIVGGVLDITATDIGDTQSGFSTTPAFYTVQRELDYYATARLRLGYAVNDRFMVYGTGGVAYGDIDYSYLSDTPATVEPYGGDDDDFGYVVGAGAETMVTDMISLGVEYQYVNLGDSDFGANLSGVAPFSGAGSAGFTNSVGTKDDFDFHTIQVKMSLRF